MSTTTTTTTTRDSGDRYGPMEWPNNTLLVTGIEGGGIVRVVVDGRSTADMESSSQHSRGTNAIPERTPRQDATLIILFASYSTVALVLPISRMHVWRGINPRIHALKREIRRPIAGDSCHSGITSYVIPRQTSIVHVDIGGTSATVE